MRRILRHASLLALLLGAAACSAPQDGGSGPAPRRSRSVITEAEIRASTASSVLDLIARERPRWFRQRGIKSMHRSSRWESYDGEPIRVYINHVEQPGGLDYLRRVDVSQVSEVRYLNAREATTRYGRGHTEGAIVLTLRS